MLVLWGLKNIIYCGIKHTLQTAVSALYPLFNSGLPVMWPGFDSILANDYLQLREPHEAYQVVLKASLNPLLYYQCISSLM